MATSQEQIENFLENRDFKGIWIPKEIWLDTNLTMLEKVIAAEIDSLSGEKGCYAGNKYFADFCNCSETKVSNTIAKLIDLRYIDLEAFNGRQRVLRSNVKYSLSYKMQSRLEENARQTYKKCKADLQKVHAINTYNNTNNNILNKESEQVAQPTKQNNNFLQEMLEKEAFGKDVADKISLWVKYKIEKKSAYKPTGFKVFLGQVKKALENYGSDYVLSKFDYSMAQNWQGVFFDKSDNQTKVGTPKDKRKYEDDDSGFYG